ncbi:MAG: hypothetical protein J6V09_00615 [Clostridia bacterium]|nr:hypothetical protein [Clostridia bacterium]
MHIIFAIIVLILSLISSSFTTDYRANDAESYQTAMGGFVSECSNRMPRIEELGEYKSIFVSKQKPIFDLWLSYRAIAVIVEYDEAGLQQQLAKISEGYDFIEEEIPGDVSDLDASVNGFQFAIVEDPDDLYLRWYVMIIGVNQHENKVAYLLYAYDGIDGIDDLDKFITTYFILE